MCVCVCVCVCVCLYSLCVCVCVCVCVCERVCTCLCKLMRERRGGGKGGGCKCWSSMVKVHWPAQLPSFRAPPPSHHLTTTLTFLRRGGARLRVSDFECRVEIPRFRTLTRNRKSKLRYNSSPDGGKPFELSRQWWCWRLAFFFFFFLSVTFKKKRKIIFKKVESKKKKAEFRRKAENWHPWSIES